MKLLRGMKQYYQPSRNMLPQMDFHDTVPPMETTLPNGNWLFE
jgi:hypothetical protein